MSKEVLMTLNGKQILETELNQLVKVERQKVTTQIAEARELGDLKENAEYHAAKEKQSHLEGRILELQGRIANAKVIDVARLKSNKIVFGATVTLLDVDKDENVTYQIVGEEEADRSKGKISYRSPIALALLGKEEGDEVIVQAPKGKITFEVEDIEYK